jgi:hypothetical protein
MEAGALEAVPRNSICGGREKKNGEVNSPTPGNQYVGGPHSFRGNAGRRLLYAIVDAFAGYRIRKQLVTRSGMKDLPVAVAEDLGAVGLALVVVVAGR